MSSDQKAAAIHTVCSASSCTDTECYSEESACLESVFQDHRLEESSRDGMDDMLSPDKSGIDGKLYHPDSLMPLGDILHPDDLERFQPSAVDGSVYLTKSGRSTMQQENLLRLQKIWQNLDEIGLSRPLRKTAKPNSSYWQPDTIYMY